MYYEGGIREPMIVKWPGTVKPNTVSNVPVISTDFYPTLLQISGAKTPDDYPLDGLSILPLLEGLEMPVIVGTKERETISSEIAALRAELTAIRKLAESAKS